MYLKILTTLLISSFLLPAVQARVRTIAQDSILVLVKGGDQLSFFHLNNKVVVRTKDGTKYRGRIQNISSQSITVGGTKIPLDQLAKIKRNPIWKIVLGGILIPIGFLLLAGAAIASLDAPFPVSSGIGSSSNSSNGGGSTGLAVAGVIAIVVGISVLATTGYKKMDNWEYRVMPVEQEKRLKNSSARAIRNP